MMTIGRMIYINIDNMKVYYIGGNTMGCWYVRCYLPMLTNGWSGNYWGVSTANKNLKPFKVVEEELQNADVVVFHRPNTKQFLTLADSLRRMGKMIVMDNDDTFLLDKDDTFYDINKEGQYRKQEEAQENLVNFAQKANLITVSTEYLAEEYRQYNPNVKVLPNCVNPWFWDEPQENKTDKVRVGMFGSVAYAKDYHGIEDFIRQLDEDPKVQLVMFGLHSKAQREKNPVSKEIHKREYAFWDSLKNLEHAPFVPIDQFFDTLNDLTLDITLIPRHENHFNKCKSNIKFLESGMLKIPVIANKYSDSPYKELDGKIGIQTEDWEKDTYRLIEDKKLRKEIGENAHKYVLDNYNIKDHAHKWREAYLETFNS